MRTSTQYLSLIGLTINDIYSEVEDHYQINLTIEQKRKLIDLVKRLCKRYISIDMLYSDGLPPSLRAWAARVDNAYAELYILNDVFKYRQNYLTDEQLEEIEGKEKEAAKNQIESEMYEELEKIGYEESQKLGSEINTEIQELVETANDLIQMKNKANEGMVMATISLGVITSVLYYISFRLCMPIEMIFPFIFIGDLVPIGVMIKEGKDRAFWKKRIEKANGKTLIESRTEE